MESVLVGGPSYGLHNIGDEAILECILNSLCANVRTSVLTFGSEWLQDSHPDVKRILLHRFYAKPIFGLTATPRRKIFSAVKESYFPDLSIYDGCDLFICGGGTLLSDCPWHALHFVELAKKANVPVILWAVGMSEVRNAATIKKIAKTCNDPNVLHVYTRDCFVQKRLIELGVEGTKISVCYDPAYTLKGGDDIASSILSTGGYKRYVDDHPNIALSVAAEPDVIEKYDMDEMEKLVRILSLSANLFLIPTGWDEKCRDKELLKQLCVNERIELIEREITPNQLTSFLSNMDVIVSSRLHCSIFGACSGVPSINLMRNEKLRDFSLQFDLPYYPLDSFDHKKIIADIETLLGARREKSDEIKNKVNYYRQQYYRACEEVRNRKL